MASEALRRQEADPELLALGAMGNDPLAWLFNFVRPFPVTVTCTSSGNHVKTSWHYQHRAIDVVGDSQTLARVMAKALKNAPSLKEAFYDPAGKYVKNGSIRNGAIGGHGYHVHLAR